MGKVVAFCELKLKNEPEGIQLYYKHYKVSTGKEREKDLNKIAKDIGCQSCYDRTFLKGVMPQDALELIGYAASRRVIGTTEATASYYKMRGNFIDDYGF